MLNVSELIKENAAILDTDPDAKEKRLAIHRRVADAVWPKLRGSFYQHRVRQSCIAEAMAVPLPGASADAFLRGAVKIDDYVIYEVMPVHHKALQAVNSPLLDLVQSAVASDEKKANREFETQDERELCFIFTENPEVLEDTPKGALPTLIHTGAKEKFGKSNSALMNGICNAVVAQFHRHIQTTVKYAAQLESQADVGFFQVKSKGQ